MYSKGSVSQSAFNRGISQVKENRAICYMGAKMINKRNTDQPINPSVRKQKRITTFDFSKQIEMHIGSEFKDKSKAEILVDKHVPEERCITEFDFNNKIQITVISVIGDKLDAEKIKLLTPINRN